MGLRQFLVAFLNVSLRNLVALLAGVLDEGSGFDPTTPVCTENHIRVDDVMESPS